MKRRCFNPGDVGYQNYGGRGITVCEAWLDFKTFYDWAITRWAPTLTIERVDNSLGYSPENCTFVTREENLENRRCTIWTTHKGERISCSALVKHLGARYHLVAMRLKRGMSGDEVEADLRSRGHIA